MYDAMIKSINASELPEEDVLIKNLRSKLPKVYNGKNAAEFADAFREVLKIGIAMDYKTMMLYLPSRPQLSQNLVAHFQNINKAIATRSGNKDWFHDLFALFIALPGILSLSWDEIEKHVVSLN
ncbi:hypothetical protein SAMN05443252_105377 [Bacillus sp. OV322]|nr:hypothetical protein SAMN05443252_105377 [Bacillus sp. OV322]